VEPDLVHEPDILHELINVAQVTSLLTIAIIEGQGTPYWFIERLSPDDQPEPGTCGSPQDLRRLADRDRLLASLKSEITPLSRQLLRTYVILDRCWDALAPHPLTPEDRAWLLDQVSVLEPAVRRTNEDAALEENPLRIVGALVGLVGTMGDVLVRALSNHVDGITLGALAESLHGVAALYHAIGYTSQEQRDVLDSELSMLLPVLSGIEQELR
jgi:hypothetical protein